MGPERMRWRQERRRQWDSINIESLYCGCRGRAKTAISSTALPQSSGLIRLDVSKTPSTTRLFFAVRTRSVLEVGTQAAQSQVIAPGWEVRTHVMMCKVSVSTNGEKERERWIREEAASEVVWTSLDPRGFSRKNLSPF